MNLRLGRLDVFGWLAVSVFASIGVGCAGSNQVTTGLIAVQDKGRATSKVNVMGDDGSRCEWRGRADREASETAGPGALFPNIRRVYQYIGTAEDRRRVLVCREVDTNLDGIKDVVRTFNDKGQSETEQADTDYDGKIDTWIKFSNGRIIEVNFDRDGDGKPDETKYYAGGSLIRVRRDLNRDEKPDVWEFYTREGLERMGRDVDYDGTVDRWDHDELRRRAIDAAERAQERAEQDKEGSKTQAVPTAADTSEKGPDNADKKDPKKGKDKKKGK